MGFWSSVAVQTVGGATEPLGRNAGILGNIACPTTAPTIPMLLDAWQSGYAGFEDVGEFLRWHGAKIMDPSWSRRMFIWTRDGLKHTEEFKKAKYNIWDSVLFGRLWTPSLDQIWELLNRRLLTRELAGFFLHSQGMHDKRMREVMLELRHVIPPPTDLIRFAVREGWDDGVAQRFGYDEDFPTEFRVWGERLGFSIIGADDPRLPPGKQDADWLKMYWRVHWDHLSPTQAYDAYHRLRPSRIARYREAIPGVEVFNLDDLRTNLRIADYPRKAREVLAATAFRPVTRVDIRRLYETGVIDEIEVNEKYLDIGYAPADARELTTFTVQEAGRKAKGGTRGDARGKIVQALEVGVIDEGEARGLLAAAKVPADEIERVLSGIRFDVQIRRARRAVAIMRRQFMRGVFSESDVRQQLRAVGIRNEAIDRYLLAWRMEQLGPKLDLTLAQVVSLRSKGTITEEEARRRLKNLNVEEAAAELLLRQAGSDLARSEARAEMAAARTEAQRQAALKRAMREAESVMRQARSDLSKHGSPSMVKRWLRFGLMTEEVMRDRLIRLGWPEEDITRWILQAKEEEKRYLAQKRR